MIENEIPFGVPSSAVRKSVYPGKWAAMPAWVRKLGFWAWMSGVQKGIYGVLVFNADNRTHKTRITHIRLAKESGVAIRSIPGATQKLVLIGVINKQRRGNRMEYEVLFAPPYWATETDYWAPDHLFSKKSYPVHQKAANGQFI